MSIARAGLPFIGAFAGVALLAALLGWLPIAIIGAVLAAAMLFFFRDPDRHAPVGSDLVLAPGDGRIVDVGTRADGRVGLSIFLGLLDVHVNRAPADGTVRSIEKVKGRFLPAYKSEAAEENEQVRVVFDTQAGALEMRQIVGIAARRIEFWPDVGEAVRAGDRVGVMKFGSRIDLMLPAGSRLEASIGQTVRAGETVIARLSEQPMAASQRTTA